MSAALIKETINILNRFSGAVQFAAEIECRSDEWPSIKLGIAIKAAIKGGADLRDADLRDAVLRGADLRDADLRYTDLSGADLSGADLSGADLRDAVLRGAVLSGEKITRWLASVDRSDGYQFVAVELQYGGYKIKAGCRWFSDAEFRAHVAKEYPDTPKAAETLDILNFIQARANSLGVKP